MTETVTLTVTGMKCGGCEANVSSQLNALDGVLKVSASSKAKEVEVEFDAENTDVAAIKAAITKAGYAVE